MGKRLTDAQIKRLAEKGKTTLIKGFKQEEETVDGFLELNNENKVFFSEAEPEKLTCPSCKAGEIIKGNTAWGCSNYKAGCKVRIPFEIQDKNLTESHMNQLVLKGLTRSFTITDQSGKKTTGIFRFDSQFKVIYTEK